MVLGLVLALAKRIYRLEVFRQRGIADIVASQATGDMEERGEFVGRSSSRIAIGVLRLKR